MILDEFGNKPNKAKNIEYNIIENNCWECISHPIQKGYPKVNRTLDGVKFNRANRYVYYLYKGKFPLEYVIMHTCDNPSCINPEHLKHGTYRDNIDDMVNKGRASTHRKGLTLTEEQRYKYRKLTKEQFIEIKKLLNKKKLTYKQIADMFNVSKATICRIAIGETYSD